MGKRIFPVSKAALSLLLAAIVFTQSGCAILQLPGQIIGGTFSVLKEALRFASKLPMPPPGVF